MPAPPAPVRPGRVGEVVRRWPFASFVVAAFALSWVAWLLSFVTGSGVLLFVGGLGPAAAAALVAWQTGTVREWWQRVTRWRVSPGFYLFALGFPVVLYGSANLVAAVIGEQPDLSVLADRAPAYAATWVGALFLGGLEEPGWRGFGQPHLQRRFSPVVATLVIGVVWGVWHLPVQPLAIVVTVPLAFFYTWLLNRTGSALLCILLHASITPAQDHLSLVPDGPTTDLAILATLVGFALAFVLLSRGRLGLRPADLPLDRS